MLYLSRDREEQKYIKFIILTFLANYCRITQFKYTAKVSSNTSVLLSIVSDTLLVEIERTENAVSPFLALVWYTSNVSLQSIQSVLFLGLGIK